MPELNLLAVFGNPIFHSRSPSIFSLLADGKKISCVFLRVAASSSEEILSFAKHNGLSGFNITAPFKQDILPMLDSVDKHARVIGAVNAVKIEKGLFQGCNTDYIGVIDAIKNTGSDPTGSTVVILGAGGAARAAAYGMVLSRAKKVFLVNRTREKAQTAASRLKCDSIPWKDRYSVMKKCDILISCIPQHPLDPYAGLLPKKTWILTADYKFHSANSVLSGNRHINGREWLLYQALPGFKFFFGQEAPRHVIPQVRNILAREPRSDKTNIALIGFMGSGKTTIGRELAKKLGYIFVDTDTEITHEAGKTIPHIFRENGEGGFRAREKSLIKKLVPQAKQTVFALGGGAVIDKTNLNLIRENCLVIWLWAPLEHMLNRIEADTRPLLDTENTLEKACALLKSRKPDYAAASDLVINTGSGSTDSTAKRIKNEIGPSF